MDADRDPDWRILFVVAVVVLAVAFVIGVGYF